MTNYIKEINGIPESLNPGSLPINAHNVSNFNRLDEETLRNTYGYFSAIDTEQPNFDPDTQNISCAYEKQGNTYIQTWSITNKTQEELDEILESKKNSLLKYTSKKKENIIAQGFNIASSGSPESPVQVQTSSLIDIINLMGTVIGAIVKKQINNTNPIPYRGKDKQQHILDNDSVIEIGMGTLNQIQQIYGKALSVENKIELGQITTEAEIDLEFE